MAETNLFFTGKGEIVMFEIEMTERSICETTSTSSKGNQLKWEQGGWWYKADCLGYEGLAEVAVSRILSYSNLDGVTEYEPGIIFYRGLPYRGCRSRNFLKKSERLVTLEHLHRSYYGIGLAGKLAKIQDVEERIAYTTDFVEKVTDLKDVGIYLTKILEMDAFFLNEDRHTNNIAVIYDEEKNRYRRSPFFDMGLSLFSDVKEAYPISKSIDECRKIIEAKPFSRDFDEQLDAANTLYGDFMRLHVSRKQMERIVKMAGQEAGYPEEETERVISVLRMQIRKYTYILEET